MYLKRIESIGFKSFAEKINVDFVPGVTAVVGPNGSGKSNITDAIRWVLGEQSAKSLRGSKMEDIIFQGSDSRKPLNFAEVTLVLDNSDQALSIEYQEVSVTRRVYRSGESEFSINKQSCRLKDIVNLFLDSGLGREAFSIISQGKVEEILSSKAEERRVIFEEAAGVLKYKNRKKKAEAKLSETQENLNRINDIVYEIEGQLEPLKEQAAVAKEYLTKKEELKEVEISLLVTEIEVLHKEWEGLLAELGDQKEKEQTLFTAMELKRNQLQHKRSELDSCDSELEKLQEELLILTQELESLEGKKQLASERNRNLEENKKQAEASIQSLLIRLDKAEADFKKEKESLKKLESDRRSAKKSTNDLAEQLSSVSENISAQIEDLKSEYIECLNEQAAKRNELQSIERQLTQNETKQKNQNEKFQVNLNQRESLTKALQENLQEVKHAENFHQEAQQELDSLKKHLHSDRQEYQDLQSKLYQGYQHIEKLKSKKEMLEDMKESYQGFFHGVKEVLKAGKEEELKGIHGAVLEVIEVSGGLITAMETALGGQAQHIIVENDASARSAINWLRQTNRGRATFLPLSSIRGKSFPSNLLQMIKAEPGFIGVASNLISYDSVYQSIVESLLGNIVIVEDLQSANRIAAILQRRYRVVTKEGDVVNPGGSMTGGAQKKTGTSLFSRDKELEEITEKLVEFNNRTTGFEQVVKEKKKAIEELDSKLEDLAAEVEKRSKQEIVAKSSGKEIEYKLQNVNANLKLYDMDSVQFQKDKANLCDQKEKLVSALYQLEREINRIQHSIDSLSEKQSRQVNDKEQVEKLYHKQQIILTELDTKLKGQKEKVSGLETSLLEIKTEMENAEKRLNAILEFEETESVESIDKKWKQTKVSKEKIEKSVREMKQKRLLLIEAGNSLDSQIKEEARIHQNWLKSMQEKEVRVNRLDVDLDNRLGHLQQEYTLSYERASKEYEKAANIEEAKRTVKLIKRSITELGIVNLGAIEEHERIEERYVFLTEQRTDLQEAKDTLFHVIKEMDEEMVSRFMETFESIKTEFSVVFQQLFGGGRAELKLTDPENLLTTGVDIIAQPHGKKLQHLGLLSGGERALTAIALLFSILRVRPVPFCVLDEVEAALDDANVSRFARYLKDYSEQTQFIVITHRKGTMEEADVLYGVTMQEAGVSRLVSVKLEDAPALVKI